MSDDRPETPPGEGPADGDDARARNQRTLSNAALLAVAMLVGACWQLGVVQTVRVASVNMAPTLEPDDRVVVRGVGQPPGLGDVVVYRTPFDSEHLQVGRIVAVEGDHVEMTDNGLQLDGRAVTAGLPGQPAAAAGDPAVAGDTASASRDTASASRDTASASRDEARTCQGAACLVAAEAVGEHHYFTRRAGPLATLQFPLQTVPEGHVFVLSDNRVDERDSRIYGAIPRSAIVGVASFVYYASDQTGIRWDRMNRRVS